MKPMGFAPIRMRLASCSSTGFMKHRIAIVCCCLMVIQSSIVGAADIGMAAAQPDATQRRSSMGPLRRASLTKAAWAIPSEPASNRGQDQDPAAAPAPDTRSWAERHPVWTGAMIGFSAGFLLTYAVAASDDHHNELLHPVGPGGPALVWGGVAAGVGALAGWGIGRSKHDGYHDRNRVNW